MGSHEMGMGTATVQAQLAAELLGLPVEHVRFDYGDSSLTSGTVAGDRRKRIDRRAPCIAARDKLVKELLKLAGNDSPLAGLEARGNRAARQGLGARTRLHASKAMRRSWRGGEG